MEIDVNVVFVLAIMLVSLLYLVYRMFLKQDIVTLAAIFLQVSSTSFAFYIFIRNVQVNSFIKMIYLAVGIILPICYFIFDLLLFSRRINQGSDSRQFIIKKKRATGFSLINSLTNLIETDFEPSSELDSAIIQDNLSLDATEISDNIKKIVFQAHTSINKKEYDAALHIYEILVKLVKNNPYLLYNIGLLYLKTGNYSESADFLLRSASSAADDNNLKYLAFLNRGHAMYKASDYIESEDSYSKAFTADPCSYEACYLSARALAADGRFEEASARFSDASVLSGSNSKAFFMLGIINKQNGDTDKAIEYFEASVVREPVLKETYLELARLETAKCNYSKASDNYDKLLSIDNNNTLAYYLKGNVLYEEERYEDAIVNYKKSLQIDPDNHKARHNLASALESVGRIKEAESMYRKAISLRPDRPDSFNSLGVMLCKAGRVKDALSIYTQWIQNSKADFKMHYNMGVAYSMDGNDLEAINCFKRAIRLKPEELMLYYHLGSSYIKLHKYSDAIKSFKKALSADASNSEILYLLAEAYAITKENDIAIETLKQAIEIDPEIISDILENRAFIQLRKSDSFASIMSEAR